MFKSKQAFRNIFLTCVLFLIFRRNYPKINLIAMHINDLIIWISVALTSIVSTGYTDYVNFTIGALLSSPSSMQHFNSTLNDVRAHVSDKQISFIPITEVGIIF